MKDIDEYISNHLECKRALAVKMDLKGYGHDVIADLLHVSCSFIRKWKNLYRKHGSACFSLHYKGRQPFLSAEELHEVITFLSAKEYYAIDDLRDYIEEHYDVVFKSKQSYYDLLHKAHISWKKTTGRHADHDPDKVAARHAEIKQLLASRKAEIESGELVVFMEDECHLLWGDTIGYIWGRTNERIVVSIKNLRDRQTYYGAINMVTKRFHVSPYDAGNSSNTVKFVKFLQQQYPKKKVMFIWDGATYHTYKGSTAKLARLITLDKL